MGVSHTPILIRAILFRFGAWICNRSTVDASGRRKKSLIRLVEEISAIEIAVLPTNCNVNSRKIITFGAEFVGGVWQDAHSRGMKPYAPQVWFDYKTKEKEYEKKG